MVKDIATILKELGINLESETLLEDTINKLLEYSVVNENELLGIQNVSVQPLPTIIKNDEKNLKQRMVGIVSDQEKGAVSIINKRTVLLTKIIEALKNKVESFTDLGVVEESPLNADNEQLNSIRNVGIYTFLHSQTEYLMIVDNPNSLEQYILWHETTRKEHRLTGFKVNLACRTKGTSGNVVFTKVLISETDLDKTKQEILNTLDTRLGNIKWLGNTNQDPSLTNNSFLNSVTTTGLYAYNLYGMLNLMTVDEFSTQTETFVTQHIYTTDRALPNETIQNIEGSKTHIIRTLINGVWTTKTEILATENYVTEIKDALEKQTYANYSSIENVKFHMNLLTNNKADKSYVDERIAQLVGSAPETLDTLDEIAEALQENDNVVDVLNESIATKADKSYVDEKIGNIQTLLEAI